MESPNILPKKMTKIGAAILVPDEWFAREFGVTVRQFRSLAENQWGLTAIVIGKNHLYNLDFVEAAIWLASVPGGPNFYGPQTHYKEKVSKNTGRGTIRLGEIWESTSLEDLAALMSQARERNDGATVTKVLTRIRKATTQLAKS